MGYEGTRFQREVQQLKRELAKTKERERQTRQGCLDLVQAMREIVAGIESSSTPSPATTRELVDQAGLLLAPDAS